MNCTLIYPANSQLRSMPPAGLLSIGTVLATEGHPTRVVDVATLLKSAHRTGKTYIYDEIADLILQHADAEFFGLACITTLEVMALRLAESLRRRRPDACIVLGNANATALDIEYLQAFSYLDFIVRGEGEETTKALCAHLQSADCPITEVEGITYRSRGRILRNRDRTQVSHLDSLPTLDYRLLEGGIDAYRDEDGCLEAILPVGRGCTFNCHYCTTPGQWRRTVRLHSAGRVAAEAVRLAALGATSLHFDVDNFATYKAEAMDICAALRASGFALPWVARCRLDSLDDEILGGMRSAGCRNILVGVESGDDEVLRSVGKELSVAAAAARIESVVSRDIGVLASFIVGLPSDSMDSALKTLRLAAECAALSDTSQSGIHYVSPLPGTTLTRQALRDGQLRLATSSLVSPDFGQFLEWSTAPDTGHPARLPEDQALIASHPGLFSSYWHFHNPHASPTEFALVGSYIAALLNAFPHTWKELLQPKHSITLPSLLAQLQKHNFERGISLDEMLLLRDTEKPRSLWAHRRTLLDTFADWAQDTGVADVGSLAAHERWLGHAWVTCRAEPSPTRPLTLSSILAPNYARSHLARRLLARTKGEACAPDADSDEVTLVATLKVDGKSPTLEVLEVSDSLASLLGAANGRRTVLDVLACLEYSLHIRLTSEQRGEALAALASLGGYITWQTP